MKPYPVPVPRSSAFALLGALVLLLAAHLGGGLRLLALEFLPWRGWQKSLAACAAALALAAGLAFALAL